MAGSAPYYSCTRTAYIHTARWAYALNCLRRHATTCIHCTVNYGKICTTCGCVDTDKNHQGAEVDACQALRVVECTALCLPSTAEFSESCTQLYVSSCLGRIALCMFLTQSYTEVQPLPVCICLCVHANTTATTKHKPLTSVYLLPSPEGGHSAVTPPLNSVCCKMIGVSIFLD